MNSLLLKFDFNILGHTCTINLSTTRVQNQTKIYVIIHKIIRYVMYTVQYQPNVLKLFN